MSKAKELYKYLARYYDKGTSLKIFKKDILFFIDEIGTDKKVLELGCGTGRVAIELAKHGNNVTGLDLSDEMIKRFKEKTSLLDEKIRKRIEISKGDMANFILKEKYDYIIFPFRSFQALTTCELRESCLKNVKKHLKEKGRIILDLFNPNEEKLNKFESIDFLDYDFYDEEFVVNVKRYNVGKEHDKKNQIIRFDYKFELEKGNKAIIELVENMELGYLYDEQVRILVKRLDLIIDKVYGWWDKTPVNENKKQELIYILKKNY